MNSQWKKGTGILTGIYVSRMLGMFMVFPVFSLYAIGLIDATPALVGFALGVYGLSQGVLQIPFGMASDRFGRKSVIAFGLILFVVGSLIAAMADTIWQMIIGRTIQGMGAISAVTLAYATDITPKEKLGRVMAIIGGSIGMSFVVSLMIGPVLAQWISVRGLFYVIAMMATLAFIGSLGLPATNKPATLESSQSSGHIDQFALWQASGSIFVTHAIFTASFVVLPIVLADTMDGNSAQWWIYLPANFIALAFMRYKASPHPLTFGVNFIILAVGLALIAIGMPMWGMLLAVSVFFIAFYRLETGLPHWVATVAEPNARGKAMGIYSTMQFFGSFMGGALGGWLWQLFDHTAYLFLTLVILAAISALFLLSIGKKDTLNSL